MILLELFAGWKKVHEEEASVLSHWQAAIRRNELHTLRNMFRVDVQVFLSSTATAALRPKLRSDHYV